MTDDWRIGFTMHPRWIDGSTLQEFIQPLRQAGLSTLEFELDDHLDGWDAFKPLMIAAVENGLGLTFHAPYRQPRSILGFSGGNCRQIQEDHLPLLQIAQDWAVRTNIRCPVVFHAAMSPKSYPLTALIEDTVAYLDWIGVSFPQLRVALENNHPPSGQEVKVCINYADTLSVLERLANPSAGICWDMGHDFLRRSLQLPPREWLERVFHIHVHDVDEHGLDHYPLVFGNVPAKRWLSEWRRVGHGGTVILELKGERLVNWGYEPIMKALKDSIATISEALL